MGASAEDVEDGAAERPELGRVDADSLHAEPGEVEPVEPPSRRRRPTGEAPPLPRAQRWRGYRWLIVAVAAASASLLLLAYQEAEWVLSADGRVAEWFVAVRTPGVVGLARTVEHLGDDATLLVLRWATVLVLLAVRRFRHLAVLLGVVLVAEWAATGLNHVVARPRPMVEILGSWDGFSHPSRPVTGLAVTLVAMRAALVPPGPVRRGLLGGVTVVVAAVAVARLVLGVDHLSDVLIGAAIGAGIGFVGFRLLAPTDVFPVVYRRGQAAHLDLDDARREAITIACRHQLGLDVVDLELHAAAGSAGSTPLRLKVRGPDRSQAFAKIYSRQHLRSDRAYKLVRNLLYGRLEDETPFGTVRRLVMYEDHLTRALRDADVPVPEPLGVAEITPDREYLIAFEFLPGDELTGQLVDEAVIADGMRLVQKLWAGGFAHRDLKPANLLIVDGQLRLIDTAFAQLRPSPWRQAVDLGAMMLTLALSSDAETVHRVASGHFSADELAEAFAATQPGVLPTQLRTLLAEDDRDLLGRMRELSSDPRPIRVQRWGRQRLGLLGVAVAVTALSAYLAWVGLRSAGML